MADKKVRLLAAEMKALAVYDFELLAAYDGHYLRSTGRKGQELLHQVYKRATGEDYRRTDTCGRCEYELTSKVAKWYFETKNAPKPVKTKKA